MLLKVQRVKDPRKLSFHTGSVHACSLSAILNIVNLYYQSFLVILENDFELFQNLDLLPFFTQTRRSSPVETN